MKKILPLLAVILVISFITLSCKPSTLQCSKTIQQSSVKDKFLSYAKKSVEAFHSLVITPIYYFLEGENFPCYGIDLFNC